MKKFFIVLLALALVAGNLFAEVTIGGSFVGLWRTSGSSEEDASINFSFGPNNGGIANAIRPRVNVTAVNEDGTFGGWVQLRPGKDGVTHNGDFLANGWWKPIEQVKFTYGYLWGGSGPIGVALASDDIFGIPFSGRNANYIPWGYEVLNGVHIELTPVEGLYAVVSIPLDNTGNLSYNGWNSPYYASNATAGAILAHTMGRIAYTINGVGTARVTIAGGTGNMSGLDIPTMTASTDTTTIDIGFALTAVENLTVDLGFEYKLAVEKIDGLSGNGYGADAGATYQDPMSVGLRVNFSSGAFSVAGGVAGGFGGKVTPDIGDAYDKPFTLGVTVNPAFDAGFATIGIVGDINYVAESKYSGITITESALDWKVIPYLTKNAGGASLSLGFELGVTAVKDKDDPITWAIPIGFEYYF
ncbi:MAG: hypothetical protein LBK73_09540 [Treponema sp.]|jgi:hypothetical protein|nr:hypothetical protein [Treponema sp.]